MNRPEHERIVIASMLGIAGFMLCGSVLVTVDPAMDLSVIQFFSALSGIVLAGIAFMVG